MVRFHRIARIAIVSATICVTVGASGVLATMTWQVPGDAKAATESLARAASPSLIMTAANAYIDGQSAKMALETMRAAKPAAIKASPARPKDMASFAQFQLKCLKKVSKRRNAKLVRVPCTPLQGEDVLAAEDAPIIGSAQSPKAPRHRPYGTLARKTQ